MKQKGKGRIYMIGALAAVVLLAAATGLILRQGRKAAEQEASLAEALEEYVRTVRRASFFAPVYMEGYYGYQMQLNRDGTFHFVCLTSSQMEPWDGIEDHYRWSGDTLILDYTDSDSVLYFQKEGDRLVFKESQSVVPEGPYDRLYDGQIFKLWKVGGRFQSSAANDQ
ncbi:MAG: hypothetical protein NC517_00870 [Firmicutes bacterium]|nr:hypothetical protein [Bacillota bacterium]